jgi:hypothetical protein
MAWGNRAAPDVVLGFATWEVLQGDPYLGSELLAVARHGKLYEESFIQYVMVRDRLMDLPLEGKRLAAARDRGASIDAGAVLELYVSGP